MNLRTVYMYSSRRVVQQLVQNPVLVKNIRILIRDLMVELLWKKSRSEDKILSQHVYKFIHNFEPINQKQGLKYHR